MDTDEEIRTAKSVWNRQNTVGNCKATEVEREEGGGLEKVGPRLCIQDLREVRFKVGVFKAFGSGGLGLHQCFVYHTIFCITFEPGSLQIRQIPNVNVSGTNLCPRSSSGCNFTPKDEKKLPGYTF